MEEAFLRFEIEIMELGNLENVVNCVPVVVKVGTSGNSNVIHIDMDRCSKGFVFENDVLVDVVHHGLERCWRVGESEIHDCGFEKSISGFKCCLFLIPFADSYVVITPLDIKLHVYVCVTEVPNKVHD